MIALTLSPAVQLPDRPTIVAVSGVPGSGPVEVELERGTTVYGRPLPRARLRGGVGRLPAPALVGTYRLVVHRGTHAFRSERWILRVSPRAARGRPMFDTPAAAVREWLTHLRGRQRLVASRRWHATALDRRDRRLNAFIVIAFAPRGDTNPDHRRGLFVTIARDRVGGRWRFLQASAAPYGR